MILVKLASQFTKFTRDISSFPSPARNIQELMHQLKNEFEPLHAEIVDGACLNPFVSVIVNSMPYSDSQEISGLSFQPGDVVYLLSAIAGG